MEKAKAERAAKMELAKPKLNATRHVRGGRSARGISGMTGVNVGVISNAPPPFGDIQQSGIRREGGPEGLLEYLDVKYAMFANPTLALGR
jgi:acyl-CoA reductase-like NAD-dependent aldehyde dehydrogenase